MITRRNLLGLLSTGALAAPLACFAQQQRSKVTRIGLLESASSYAKGRAALSAGLRELGYVEGQDLVIEARAPEGNYERLPSLAAELLQMKVDALVAAGGQAIIAAQQATATLPIVMVVTADPVGFGFVASLAKPGRNITGLSTINVDLSSKYIELLRDAAAKLSRVATLMDPGSRNVLERLERIQAAGETSGITIVLIQAATVSEIDSAFSAMKRERVGALIVWPTAFFRSQARRIADLATQHRLPSISAFGDYAESGGLMSYGQNLSEQYYRAATYIDKILKGAKPGDLPVEQPTKIELVINVKTAKAIGLVIPQNLLLRADKVIE